MKLDKVRAVLFDMDGVLYDSMPKHAKSWAVAFSKYKVKIPPIQVYEIEGMQDHKAARKLEKWAKLKLTEDEIEEISKTKQSEFDSYSSPKVIPGAKRLISHLKKNGYSVCIVTGSSQKRTIERLEKDFALTRKDIVTGKDTTKGKPNPDPYLKGLRKLKAKAEEAVVIENAPLGIQSARRAKIKCIALVSGPIKKPELIKKGAHLVVKDLSRLIKLFGKR